MPYTHFITRGFTFKHDNDDSYHVRFNDTNRLIISNFYHKIFNLFMHYHRNFNTIFTFDWIKDYQWLGIGRALTCYFINETIVNRNVNINKFLADYYIQSKKGDGYTVGTVEERQALDKQKIGFLMPIAQKEKCIKKNELLYTCKTYLKGRRTFLNDCKYVQTITVNENAFNKLNSLYPNFTLKLLDCCKIATDKDFYWKDDDLLTPNSQFL